MYYRPPSQRGPYVSKGLVHDKKSAGDNRPPRDAFDLMFSSPPPAINADDYSLDGLSYGLIHTGTILPALTPSTTGLQNTSFSSHEARSLSPFSRTTSQNGALDAQQEKTAHKAYHISFNGDKRVKETNVTVTINDAMFLLVERTTCGQSDGVYQKNKKLWEHVPRGQLKVFVSVPLPESTGAMPSAPSTPMSAPRSGPEDLHSTTPLSARGSASGGGGARSHYECLGALCGLRKFGHWGDKSAAVYAVPKETVTEAIAIERVDGIAGHVAAVTHNAARYWAVGCTARHVLTRLDVPEEDVLAYAAGSSPATGGSLQDEWTESLADGSGATSTRTSVADAQAIARAWRAWLRTFARHAGPSAVDELHETIREHKWTLCFDALLDERDALIDYSVDGMAPMCTCGTSLRGTCVLHEEEADEENGTDAAPLSGSESEPREEDVGEGAPTNPLTRTPCETDGRSMEEGQEEDAMRPLPSQTLVFYAITTDTASTKGLCLPVARAYEVFRTYGLTTAVRSVSVPVGSEAYTVLRDSIAAKLYSAGAVFYGANEAGTVVQLWKCRCTHHTMERVAQESVVTNGVCGAALRAKLKKSISNMPKTTRGDAQAWEAERGELLAEFSAWLYETKRMSPSMDATAKRSIRDHWLSLQRTFYDHACAQTSTEEEEEEGEEEENDQEVGTESHSPVSCVSLFASGTQPMRDSLGGGPEAILMVGPQGCGKSTLARVLFALLEQCQQAPRWLNQDEVGSRRAYISAIARTVEEGICTHLLLDKMNLSAASRTADYGGLGLRSVLTIAWTHRMGAQTLADVCFDRICQRGDSHRSLKASAPLSQKGSTISGSGNEQALRRLRGILDDSVAKMEAPAALGSSLSRRTSPNASVGERLPHGRASHPTSASEDNGEGHSLPTSPASPTSSTSAAPSRVVELDVCWTIEACLAQIWPRLCLASSRALPGLDWLDVPAAVRMSHAYEALLSRHRHRTTSVVLELASVDAWTRHVPAGLAWHDKSKPPVRPPAHFVIHDFIADPSPSLLVEYDALNGSAVELALEAVVSDCRATVLCAHQAPFLRRSSNLEMLRQQSGSAADFLAGSGTFRRPSGKGPSGPAARALDEPPLLFAIVAQAKKVTQKYCRELVERVLVQGEQDPYCTVLRLPQPATVTVTYALKSV